MLYAERRCKKKGVHIIKNCENYKMMGIMNSLNITFKVF